MSKVEGRDKLTYAILKRILDIIGAIAGCLITLILAVVIKIANVMDKDYDSVFYKQERIGKDGRIFQIYKFRSMVLDAEKVLSELLLNDTEIREEYMRYHKLENDPRITRIGKFIRRTSLDEFPQFINVLKGEMSLVGPRPYLVREIEDMGEKYNDIIKVKPGITGPWQTGGRSDVTFEDRLEIESRYVKEHTFFNDLKMIWNTVFKAAKGEGAG